MNTSTPINNLLITVDLIDIFSLSPLLLPLLIICISLISLIQLVKSSGEKDRESTNKISIHPLTSFAEDIGLTKLGSASCCIRTTARLNTVVIAVS